MHVPYLGIYFGTFIIRTHEGRSGKGKVEAQEKIQVQSAAHADNQSR